MEGTLEAVNMGLRMAIALSP